MKIGICGPVFMPMFSEYLDEGQHIDAKGQGGTPVNHQIIALLERGHEVFVYSVTNELEPGESRYWKGKNLHVYMGPFRKRARHRTPDLYKKERRFITDKIKETNPDIVHAHWQYEYGWGAIASGKPVLLTCHDAPLKVLQAQTDLYRLIRLGVATICLRKAKYLTAVAPYTARGLRPFTRRKVNVIPNFEPDSIFDMFEEREAPQANINITMINNGFHDRKNVAVGVQAFEKFSKKYPPATLHLFGHDNGIGEDAELWCKKNNITGNVVFHGVTPFADVMKAFSSADIFLHTSLEESCPMVLIEAMAMGIPSIAGNKAGGIPWMLENGGGLLADITSPDKVYEALMTLMDAKIYKETAATARKVALQQFSKSKVIDQYIEQYKNVLTNEGIAHSF